MKDLDLLGPDADGAYVTLADGEGNRYRLRINEALRSALRPGAGRRPAGPPVPGAQRATGGSLSPREIQALLRAGVPVEEVAERSGADVSRIESYAAPIDAERAYIAQRARALRVGHVSDAPNLGDLVVDRLASRQVPAEDITWDAVRRDGHPWEVVVTFPIGSAVHEARWTVDLARHVLTATDDESRWLSETSIGGAGRRRSLAETMFATPAPLRQAPPSREESEELLDQLAASRGTRQDLVDPEDDEDARALAALQAEEEGSTLWTDLPGAHPSHSHPEEAQDAEVLSLTDRQHTSRAARPLVKDTATEVPPLPHHEEETAQSPADEAQDTQETQDVQEAQDAPDLDAAQDEAVDEGSAVDEADVVDEGSVPENTQPEEAQPEPKKQPAAEQEGLLDVDVPRAKAKKKGSRRSVPSWDEIVFGTRSDS